MKKIIMISAILVLALTACSKDDSPTEAATTEMITATEAVTEEETTEEIIAQGSATTEATTEEVTESTTEIAIDLTDELPPIEDTEGKWIYNPKVSGLSLCNERMRTEFNQESFNHAIFNALYDYDEYKTAICKEAKIIFIEPEDPFIYVVQLSFENHEDTKVYMRAFWGGSFSCIYPDELDHDPEEWTP